MTHRNCILAVSFLILASCTTERVSTEFGALNDALNKANKDITPLLERGLKDAREAELTVSAKAGDAWFLSEGCRVLLKDGSQVPTSSCRVVNLPQKGRAPVKNEASSARRKMDTLIAYVGALEQLMDATSDTAITESYAAAVAAFGDLGKAADSKGLMEFVAKRESEQEKIAKVVPAAVATLRYNRMRSVVRASNADLATVVRELQLHLVNLKVDKGTKQDPRTLLQRIDDLKEKDAAVLIFDTNDAAGYRAAIVALQDEHKDFMAYYQKTSVYKVGLVAEVHSALDKALRNPGRVEDVVGYLESLKSLIKTVEG